MKKFFALLFAVVLVFGLLAGCNSITGNQATTQSAQVTYVQACAAYGAAFSAALDARQAGKLSQAQIRQISLIDTQITPICTGPLPADPTAATQQITAAVTTMAIMGAVQYLDNTPIK